MKKTPADTITILHLSDLHFSPNEVFRDNNKSDFIKKYWSLFMEGKTQGTNNWHTSNLNRIVSTFKLQHTVNIDHIVITGDFVTCGFEDEYKETYCSLLDLQNAIFNINNNSLCPEKLSIIPGNHDVSAHQEKFLSNKRKLLSIIIANNKNLGKKLMGFNEFSKSYSLFKEYFSELYRDIDLDLLENQLFCKKIADTNICLAHLISTTNVPIKYPWYNAYGYVTRQQLDSFSILQKEYFNILLMHHPPIPAPCVSIEQPMLELLNAQEFYSTILEAQRVNLILCGHNHKFYIWDNDVWPENITTDFYQYNIPILIADASTKGNEANTIYLPLYKIQTADKTNISFNNSNIDISLLCINSNNEVEEKSIKRISGSKLNNAFNWLQSIEVDNVEGSTITAENQTIVIHNPQEEDFFDIPFKKPTQHSCDWTINMTCDNGLKRSSKNFRLSIELLDVNKNKMKSLKSNMPIGNQTKPFPFTVETNKPGHIRFKFREIETKKIKISSIIGGENG